MIDVMTNVTRGMLRFRMIFLNKHPQCPKITETPSPFIYKERITKLDNNYNGKNRNATNRLLRKRIPLKWYVSLLAIHAMANSTQFENSA
jgi:hypothetical protein